MKITIIGGGSSTFVPQLMRLFIQSEVLCGRTLALMDIDPHRLETMDRLCTLFVKRENAALTIKSTTDQRASLAGADFVIVGRAIYEADSPREAALGILAGMK